MQATSQRRHAIHLSALILMHSIIFHYPHILRQDQPLPGHDRRKTGCSYHRSADGRKIRAFFHFKAVAASRALASQGQAGKLEICVFGKRAFRKSSKQAFSVTSSTQDIRPSSQLIFFIRAFAPDVACCIFKSSSRATCKRPRTRLASCKLNAPCRKRRDQCCW